MTCLNDNDQGAKSHYTKLTHVEFLEALGRIA